MTPLYRHWMFLLSLKQEALWIILKSCWRTAVQFMKFECCCQEDKPKFCNFYSNYYANSIFCLMKKLNRSIFTSSPFNQINLNSFKWMCRLSENGMNPELCTSGSWMKHPYLWRTFSISNSLCCDSAWIWKWASKIKGCVLTWNSVRWKYRIVRSHCWSQQQLFSNLSSHEHTSLWRCWLVTFTR